MMTLWAVLKSAVAVAVLYGVYRGVVKVLSRNSRKGGGISRGGGGRYEDEGGNDQRMS